MSNRYLEKIAGLLTPMSKIKGLATNVSRGGVKGSMFGKTTTLKPSIMKVANLGPAAVLAGIGALSAGRDNRTGGAILGVGTGAVGAATGALSVLSFAEKRKKLPSKNLGGKNLGRIMSAATIAGGVTGSYLGGKIYSNSKNQD